MTSLIVLYQQMADLTLSECKKCKCPLSCCSSEYCGMAIERARGKYGVELQSTNHPTLPLMGENGCTASPHFRPLCTLHTCEINAFGFKRGDKTWTNEYFGLREQIEELEFEQSKV